MARVSVSNDVRLRDVAASGGKLAHIDALRGIAILAVVACHHALEFPALEWRWTLASYTRLGVQLFFVASAVTLCRSIEQRHDEPRAVSSFFIRRFFRIAPLYYLGLALYAFVHAAMPTLMPDHLPEDLYAPAHVVANLLFVHGFFPQAYNHVVPGGWSIAAEMAFYAVFPALFVGARTVHRRGGVRAMAFTTVGVWIACVGAQLVLARWIDMSSDDPFIYSSIFNQLPVFLVGLTGYFAIERENAAVPGDCLKRFLLLTLIVLCVLLSPVPLSDQLVPVLAAWSFVFLLGAVRGRSDKGTLLKRVGRRSYSMYILHFLPMWVVGAAVKSLAPVSAELQLLLYLPTLVAALVVTFGVACATERAIERPFITLGQRLIARRARADSGCIPRAPLYGSALP